MPKTQRFAHGEVAKPAQGPRGGQPVTCAGVSLLSVGIIFTVQWASSSSSPSYHHCTVHHHHHHHHHHRNGTLHFGNISFVTVIIMQCNYHHCTEHEHGHYYHHSYQYQPKKFAKPPSCIEVPQKGRRRRRRRRVRRKK